MTIVALTETEESALRTVYQRDVGHWNWSYWSLMTTKFGEGQMGLVWVILPYKYEKNMPTMRRRMNELYLECLQDYARGAYGLAIRLDETTHKLMLFDPTREGE